MLYCVLLFLHYISAYENALSLERALALILQGRIYVIAQHKGIIYGHITLFISRGVFPLGNIFSEITISSLRSFLFYSKKYLLFTKWTYF